MARKPAEKRAIKTSVSLPPEILKKAKETGNLSNIIKRALIYYFLSDDYERYRTIKGLEFTKIE